MHVYDLPFILAFYFVLCAERLILSALCLIVLFFLFISSFGKQFMRVCLPHNLCRPNPKPSTVDYIFLGFIFGI